MDIIFALLILVWQFLPFYLFSKLRGKKTLEKDKEALEAALHSLKHSSSRINIELKSANRSLAKLGDRLIKDHIKFTKQKLTPSNYATSKSNLEKVYDFCESNGFQFDIHNQEEIKKELKSQYEEVVRKQILKEEQARIKARIREEQQVQKERERELRRLEVEQYAIEKALAKALKKAGEEQSEEVERLKAQLKEAEERNQRAKSQAELTKAGYVYVISNVGSFGTDVFKVGMTRRLEPLDRVKELGDASVPFPFDVHMMISCDDAPSLENALHKELNTRRLNKVNLRKEFFRVNIDEIANLVEKNHGKIEYKAEPEALEYNETINMTDDDFEFVSTNLSQFEDSDRD